MMSLKTVGATNSGFRLSQEYRDARCSSLGPGRDLDKLAPRWAGAAMPSSPRDPLGEPVAKVVFSRRTGSGTEHEILRHRARSKIIRTTGSWPLNRRIKRLHFETSEY